MNSADIVDDIVGEVKTPPSPEEKSAEQLSVAFEKANEHLGLYYTQAAYDAFVTLYRLVNKRLQI